MDFDQSVQSEGEKNGRKYSHSLGRGEVQIAFFIHIVTVQYVFSFLFFYEGAAVYIKLI